MRGGSRGRGLLCSAKIKSAIISPSTDESGGVFVVVLVFKAVPGPVHKVR